MPTALKTKSRDSNTQHVMLGREQMAYARDYAKSNGYTIRSIIECSIVYWLKAQGADVPDVQQEPRTVVQFCDRAVQLRVRVVRLLQFAFRFNVRRAFDVKR